MAKNLVAGETTKITESGSNISVELNDIMKNKINSIPNITIGTTTTGDVGTEASVSNSGTATNMILNFTIPKGANGQDGQDGADGANGADGEDGITPHIGENGNWFLGEEDTGKPSRGIQGEQGQAGQPGSDGEDGQDGIGFTTASAGTPTQSDGYTVTPITFNKTDGSNVVVNVSAKNGLDGSGGTGGTTDYSELENKPKINNIELSGNKTLAELGIQAEGDYLESESDPTVPSHVKNITQQNINDWNNKSNFSGSYNDLSDKPTIPEEYSLPIASSTVLGGIKVGENLEITSDGTLNAQAGGGTGGTTDYTQLSNKPKINNVELAGNKSLSDLGIQQTIVSETEPTDDSVDVWIDPSGDTVIVPTKTSQLQNDSGFIASESDPTVPSHVKNITQGNITSWNNKSEFSGSYNDLTDKPTIPEEYSLPIASSTILGGIKVGANLEITEDGVLNAQAGGGGSSTAVSEWEVVANNVIEDSTTSNISIEFDKSYSELLIFVDLGANNQQLGANWWKLNNKNINYTTMSTYRYYYARYFVTPLFTFFEVTSTNNNTVGTAAVSASSTTNTDKVTNFSITLSDDKKFLEGAKIQILGRNTSSIQSETGEIDYDELADKLNIPSFSYDSSSGTLTITTTEV